MNARTGCFLAALMLAANSPANADTPRELINQGIEHYQAGRYAEALEAFDQVEDEADDTLAAELLHDKAATNYKLGNLDEARELWVRAAGMRDEAFEAGARYNLGNCDYSAALQAMQSQDVNATMGFLEKAIGQYRDALKLDPGLANARANLELAAQLKKQIEEMSEQQPQSQPSSQPSDQDQQQDQQQQDQEQQDQSTSQPSSQPSDQDQQDQQQDQQEQDQQQDQQQEQEEATSQPAPESQPSQQQEDEQQPEQAGEEEAQQLPQIEMTREEAERLLQQIRDAEQRRRLILRAREAAKQKPVEKDW